MYPELNGKVVLVTGGSRGIGAGTARAFAAEGARVAVLGRDRAALDKVAAEIGGLAVAADVTGFAAIEAARARTEEELGPVDVLCAFAGGGMARPGPTAEMSGMRLAATARTTISSLNPHRSSMEPPPRATISRSGRGIGPPGTRALKPWTAAATSAAEVSPCTRTGQTMTWLGKRSSRRCRMSRITAPVGEVMTPMTRGK